MSDQILCTKPRTADGDIEHYESCEYPALYDMAEEQLGVAQDQITELEAKLAKAQSRIAELLRALP